jgi:HJR/Mrr/RecB family endonuclease
MGRRRKREDVWLEVIPQAVGVLFLFALISPTVRHIISGFGHIFFLFIIIVLVALIVFTAYRAFQKSRSSGTVLNSIAQEQTETSPLRPPRSETPTNLIDQLRTIDWFQFEKLVELVYRKLGYSVSRKSGANPDGGIDLVIEKGGVRTAIQCKQWKTWNVGVKAVREFLAALTDSGIQSGIFITLSGYTGEAKSLAEKHGIQIIDETGLADLLEKLSAATDKDVLAILTDTRKFCPKCESEMVLRTAGKGFNAGQKFWGCSRYPKCRFTMKIHNQSGVLVPFPDTSTFSVLTCSCLLSDKTLSGLERQRK